MPWLRAGMTLVPSPMPMSTAPWPMSVMRSGSIWFWNVTSRPGVAVVAGLLGEVERGELDARDVAQAHGQGRDAPAARRWAPTAGAGHRWPARTSSAEPRRGDEDGEAATGCGAQEHGRLRVTVQEPPGVTASGRRPGGARAGPRRDTGSTPMAAIVSSVANMSGMSNRLPRAMLMSTPRPLVAAGPLGDDGAHDRERDGMRRPPRIAGSAAGTSTVVDQLAARGPQAAPSSTRRGSIGAHAHGRRDGHREEADERADEHLGHQAAAEPEHDERRQGEDRAWPGRPRCRATAAARRGGSGRAGSR